MSSILIVDGDKTVRTDLVVYLRGRGHHAETVADITETLPALVRQDFDLIPIDCTMPSWRRNLDRSTSPTLEHIRARPLSAPSS